MTPRQRFVVREGVLFFALLVGAVFVLGVGPFVGFCLGVLLCVCFLEYDEERTKNK